MPPNPAKCDGVDGQHEKSRTDSRRLWAMVNAGVDDATLQNFTSDTGVPLERAPLSLPGRYQSRDGNEFACETTDISSLGIGVRAPFSDEIGVWTTAQFSSLGFVEGVIVQRTPASFVVDIRVTPARLGRLAHRIAWEIRSHNENVIDRRSSRRVELERQTSTLKTSDGRTVGCELCNLSAEGAAVHLGEAALYLWVDQPVMLDRRKAFVLRHFPGGVVVKFVKPGDLDTMLPAG